LRSQLFQSRLHFSNPAKERSPPQRLRQALRNRALAPQDLLTRLIAFVARPVRVFLRLCASTIKSSSWLCAPVRYGPRPPGFFNSSPSTLRPPSSGFNAPPELKIRRTPGAILRNRLTTCATGSHFSVDTPLRRTPPKDSLFEAGFSCTHSPAPA
jgi:hypothetical protein